MENKDRFEAIIKAKMEGVEKAPSSELKDRLQYKLRNQKEYDIKNLLLIDDSISKLESAAENGINGIQYKNNEQIVREIKEYDKSVKEKTTK